MTKIFEQRKNFDLRRLLAGSERLIDHLLTNDSKKRACNLSKFCDKIHIPPTLNVKYKSEFTLYFQYRIIHSYF